MKVSKAQTFLDIDPSHIEYLPSLPGLSRREETKHSQVSQEYQDEKGLISSILGDVGSLALKGGIAYLTGGISLLRYTKTFANIAIDIKNGSLDSVWKKTFKNTSFGPKIKNIQKLIHENNDEKALLQLDEIIVELETIDDFEIRSSLNVLRGKLHYKDGRFLAAAVYYMEAASLISSQKLQKMGQGEAEGLINKSAMLYLISLQSLSAHLKINEIDGNFEFLINDLAKRATTLFDREASYRSSDCWHLKKTGDVSFGKINIPYGWFVKDEKSSDLNKKLSLEVDKIKCLIEKRDLVKDLNKYLGDELYKGEEVEFLLEVAEQVSRSDYSDSGKLTSFFEFLERKMLSSPEYNDCLSHLDILKTQVKLQSGNGSESDVLMIFKLLDKEKISETTFHHLLSVADMLSTQLTVEQRREFASVMVEKDYPLLSDNHKACYKKIENRNFISHEPEINCIYPKDLNEFKKEIQRLDIKDRAILYKGNVQVVPHQIFKEMVVKKAKCLFPQGDFDDFGYILRNDGNKDFGNIIKNDSDNLLGLATEIIINLHMAEKLPGIQDRIKHQKARIGVFGLTKVGKSTFINTLVGKEVLKSDRNVATNIVTVISKSNLNKAKVSFLNGDGTEVALEETALYTSEQGNPQNKKNVSQVDVKIDCALPKGLEIFDIPGFGVNEENYHLHQEVIDKCLTMVDGVFLVTTPNDGLKSYELEFIKKAYFEKKLPFVLIANKMDELDDDEIIDLKSGLKEKLQKHGLSNGLFPIYFVSSQLGLSFIEGIDTNRYLGLTKEQAQTESGLLLVKESIRDISDKINGLKESTIRHYLRSEVEKYKQSLVHVVLDSEVIQKKTTEDNQKNIQKLKDEISSLKILLSSEFNIFDGNVKSLANLDIEGMVNRLGTRIEFGMLSSSKDDCQIAKNECEKIFQEEVGSILQFMDEFIETCNANLKAFIDARNGTSFTFEEVQFTKDMQNAVVDNSSPIENVAYIISKLLMQSETIRNECLKILSFIKQREVTQRINQLKSIQLQKDNFEASLNERLESIEQAMEFKKDEYNEKLAYCMEQIEKCNHYLGKLG